MVGPQVKLVMYLAETKTKMLTGKLVCDQSDFVPEVFRTLDLKLVSFDEFL